MSSRRRSRDQLLELIERAGYFVLLDFSVCLELSSGLSFCPHHISLDLSYQPASISKRKRAGCGGRTIEPRSLAWMFPTPVITPLAQNPGQPGLRGEVSLGRAWWWSQQPSRTTAEPPLAGPRDPPWGDPVSLPQVQGRCSWIRLFH